MAANARTPIWETRWALRSRERGDERTLLSIEGDDAGWRVLPCGRLLQSCDCRAVALATAQELAHLRRDATGEPTGVAVPMTGGKAVMLASCG